MYKNPNKQGSIVIDDSLLLPVSTDDFGVVHHHDNSLGIELLETVEFYIELNNLPMLPNYGIAVGLYIKDRRLVCCCVCLDFL